MKNAREALKKQRAFYGRDEAKQCAVCKRWFSKRRDEVCSEECRKAWINASERPK
jgi:hypothetical protein